MRLFVFDEPTVGVDVGTRVAIYQFIRDLCEAGAAILLISSDLPEILHLTHRAYVMYRGQLRAELAGAEITEDKRAALLLRAGGGVMTADLRRRSRPAPHAAALAGRMSSCGSACCPSCC